MNDIKIYHFSIRVSNVTESGKIICNCYVKVVVFEFVINWNINIISFSTWFLIFLLEKIKEDFILLIFYQFQLH